MIYLTLTDKPFDEVVARLAVITFFDDVRPLTGQAGLLDWRLNGRISDLILKNRVDGAKAEALMMPSGGRLAANDLLLLGMGSTKELTEARLNELFEMIVEKIKKLKPADLVISFGDLGADFMSWRAVLRAFVSVLTEKLGQANLSLYCADQTAWVSEAKRRNMDFGPLVTVDFDDELTDSGLKSYVA